MKFKVDIPMTFEFYDLDEETCFYLNGDTDSSHYKEVELDESDFLDEATKLRQSVFTKVMESLDFEDLIEEHIELAKFTNVKSIRDFTIEDTGYLEFKISLILEIADSDDYFDQQLLEELSDEVRIAFGELVDSLNYKERLYVCLEDKELGDEQYIEGSVRFVVNI